MFFRVFKVFEKRKNALNILKRFRSLDRSGDRIHDNVISDPGEDCNLTGKVNS